MKTKSRFLPVPLLLLGLAVSPLAGIQPPPGNSTQLRKVFADPPAEYSTAPLWVWNDLLTDDLIIGSLRDLAGQKVKQVFVHPRPGLVTPYLSPEWFRLWKVALEEARRLDMKLWIYDENSYPSGFAGGFVPEAMPESRGRGLVFRQDTSPKWSQDTLAVFEVSGPGYKDVSAQARSATLPAGNYLVASIAQARPGPWYGGKYYVDLLYPGVTEKFLEITMDAYKRAIGSEFGKRVPGAFTDEPHLRPAGGLPWTGNLPRLFEKRWGYGLTGSLPALREASGDWKRTRHNYYQLLLEQFIERWGKPYYEYCERNGIEFTGHYWEHEWPGSTGVPDNMAMAAWQQRPGIDTLMNEYAEDTHAQFGNIRAAKEVSSVANQLGNVRTLSEGYGAGGWDLRFEDMKRIGDWLYVLGINTLDQHLSYVSIRGARKRDHPQSFSYHEPWWGAYHASAEYFSRLSAALSAGQQLNEVLLLEPTTTAWMYNTGGKNTPELDNIGKTFQDLVVSLEKAQVEYDLGCEDILARHGSVQGKNLRVGNRDYRVVVLPPALENLNSGTVRLLETFLKAGGSVLACGTAPERIDGAVSERGRKLGALSGWKNVKPANLPALLAARPTSGFAIRRAAADKGILFHHRRKLADGEMLFLVNTSLNSLSSGNVESRASGVELWDAATGTTRPYVFEPGARGCRFRFDLPPAGSLLLFLSNEKGVPSPPLTERLVDLVPVATPAIRRSGPNVLVLDYMDVRAAGETREKSYFYPAAQFAFQKNGAERNPWDSAVQFKDELVTRKFPDGSGAEATYRFTIREQVPKPLLLVVASADLYAITCNGQPVAPLKGEWWLDKSFGKVDISAAARAGENEVTLRAAPFTMYHELESAYLLGDFVLEPAASGFVITPARALGLGAWNAQGHPFYSEGVSYKEDFSIDKPGAEYRVALKRWYGSVARVTVNGNDAGVIFSSPWTRDVTQWIRPGMNSIEVTVIGTLKNTLGPHHGKPALGTAWPAMFQKAPSPGPPAGAEYSTVGYGLFEPFALFQVVQARK